MEGFCKIQRVVLLLVATCLLAACQSKSGAERAEQEERTRQRLELLMTMGWQDAAALSTSSREISPEVRVAADRIEVLRTHPDGSPRRARAVGNVFVEFQFDEPGRAICQEAFISEDELILRGQPLLQRGGSFVEGLDDVTMFYMLGPRLRVIGRHRVQNQAEILEAMRKSEASGGAVATGSGAGFPAPGTPPPLPLKGGQWAGGPNPLLPALSPDSVPEQVRRKMRAEAQAVDVIPLRVPGEEAPMPPPEPAPPQEDGLLLPVPGSDRD